MEYRNKKTGVVIEVQSEMSGDWEPVKKAEQKTAPEPKSTRGKKK